MSDTHNLALPYLAAEQAQKHVTVNEALRALDAIVQLAVKDRNLAAPPGAPTEGDRYIVAAAATGAWAGHAGDIAAWQDGAWAFYEPREGWLAWVADEDVLVACDGTAWLTAGGGGGGGSELQNLTLLGVGTAADAANPFSAKLNKALWTAKPAAEGGDGDLRYTMNKESAADVLSLLFQSAFSGRAELGLIGDDNLTCKVSADGAAWKTALVLDRTTGRVSFPSGGAREVLAANRTYYVRQDGSDANTGLADTAGGAFLTIGKALDVVSSLDLSIYNVTIQVGDAVYTAPISVGAPWIGKGAVSLRGANATGTVISTTSANCIAVTGGGKLAISRLKLQTTTGGACLSASQGGEIQVSADIDFGTCAAYHVFTDSFGLIGLSANYTISGNAAVHLLAQHGRINAGSGLTVTISGSRTFSQFARATAGGYVYTAGNLYSAAVTGQRYMVDLNGLFQTFGGGASYFPGTTAGSASTGGQYA